MGFQHQCPASSALQSELEALKEGLNLAMTKGLIPLVIETDSTEVIKALHQGCESNYMTISSCRWLIHQLKDPTIQHNFRYENQVAHNLAKEALKNPKYHLLLDRPPPYVINKLDVDRDDYVYFVKSLLTDVCCKLPNLGNISVLKSTSFYGDVTNNIP